MPDISNLASRIDAEFSAVAERARKIQVERAEEQKERQKRLEKLGGVLDELRDIWKPRLELLVKKFGERVHVEPRITPSTREADFEFQSKRSRVRLRFSATTDREVRKVVLNYDLEIIPVLMRYKPHEEIEFPLDAVNKEAVAAWFDDRVVEFVQTYLTMGEEETDLPNDRVGETAARV